jgi:hypothetical protein
MNPLDIGCLSFHKVPPSLPHLTPTLNLLNKKALTLFERKYHIVSATLLVFVDAGENLIMVDDVATPSNLPISLVEKEEFKETQFDMNVSQRSREE